MIVSYLKTRGILPIFWVIAGLLYSACGAQAQILNLATELKPLVLPENFLASLQDCRDFSYTETQKAGTTTLFTDYKIKRTATDNCLLTINAGTDNALNVRQQCVLSPQQAEDYALHLRNFISKKYSPRHEGKRLTADEDYKYALKIMTNPKLCEFHRDAIDYTRSIRDNLIECQPAKEILQRNNMEMTREITGLSNDSCMYRFNIYTFALNNDGSKTDRLKLNYVCTFKQPQREQYLQILKAQVIPEDSGYDFTTERRYDMSEELNFIDNNCRIEG